MEAEMEKVRPAFHSVRLQSGIEMIVCDSCGSYYASRQQLQSHWRSSSCGGKHHIAPHKLRGPGA
jgi:hypothetical protein